MFYAQWFVEIDTRLPMSAHKFQLTTSFISTIHIAHNERTVNGLCLTMPKWCESMQKSTYKSHCFAIILISVKGGRTSIQPWYRAAFHFCSLHFPCCNKMFRYAISLFGSSYSLKMVHKVLISMLFSFILLVQCRSWCKITVSRVTGNWMLSISIMADQISHYITSKSRQNFGK